jgi:4-alpha-glucanotransferase
VRRAVDPAAWGVVTGYEDADREWHSASPATVAALLAAIDADGAAPSADGAPLVVRGAVRRRLGAPAEVVLEDGTVLPAAAELPARLPLGYHTLRSERGDAPLIVSPGRCHLPETLRTFGWAVQLHALRSQSSWGIGDLADLGELARWAAADLGAGMVMLNPLHATTLTSPQQASPYYPSSRRFRNPLYLRIEDVPGATLIGDELDGLARAGRTLNDERLIDRDAVLRLKLAALNRIWDGRDLQQQRAPAASDLVDFATHCALSEMHGSSWRRWPEPLRDPRSRAVASFRQERQDRVDFFAWMQQLIDEQLADASAPLAVMHDLAIGVDPDGADSWLWQEVITAEVHAGAPPDKFNRLGQDWGFPPFDPWKLRAAGYRPFIDTIRSALRHAGALRVDHILGLFRLYWIPEGASPKDGAYVRYPTSDLLDILALESCRAGAYICGEDLGTFEKPTRDALAARDILSYRVLWFEEDPPAAYPTRSMAAATTHDLPTIAGAWTGADHAAQKRLGLDPDAKFARALRKTLRSLTGLPSGAPVDDVIVATYRALATAPSMVLTATLEDILGVVERPNMPGTVSGWPNWSLALPATLEQLIGDPRAARIAAVLRRDASG